MSGNNGNGEVLPVNQNRIEEPRNQTEHENRSYGSSIPGEYFLTAEAIKSYMEHQSKIAVQEEETRRIAEVEATKRHEMSEKRLELQELENTKREEMRQEGFNKRQEIMMESGVSVINRASVLVVLVLAIIVISLFLGQTVFAEKVAWGMFALFGGVGFVKGTKRQQNGA